MNARSVVLFLITFAAIVLVALIAFPFLPAITGAIGLAVITHHQHDWIRKQIKSQSAAAGLMLVLVILVLVIPAAFVVSGVARQVSHASRFFQGPDFQQSLTGLLAQYPRIGSAIYRIEQEFDLGDVVHQGSKFIASHGAVFLAVPRLLSRNWC